MARTAARTSKAGNIIERIVRYFKETRAEVGRVSWPTRSQALRLTGIVLAVTTALAVALALVDYLFAWFISRLLAFDVIVMGVTLVILLGGGIYWGLVGRRR